MLITSGADFLKKEGIILYMVCSFFEEECNDQINNFLLKNINFSVKKFSKKNELLDKNLIDKNGFFITPPINIGKNIPIDGFFAAQLKKND